MGKQSNNHQPSDGDDRAERNARKIVEHFGLHEADPLPPVEDAFNEALRRLVDNPVSTRHPEIADRLQQLHRAGVIDEDCFYHAMSHEFLAEGMLRAVEPLQVAGIDELDQLELFLSAERYATERLKKFDELPDDVRADLQSAYSSVPFDELATAAREGLASTASISCVLVGGGEQARREFRNEVEETLHKRSLGDQ